MSTFQPRVRSHQNRHYGGVTLPDAPFEIPTKEFDESAPYDRLSARCRLVGDALFREKKDDLATSLDRVFPCR